MNRIAEIAVVTGFGLCLGSFANVCIHRVPRGRSVAVPRSRCPRCFSPIRWQDNIPVLSWLLLGRRCSHCREGISPRYAVVELSMAGVFVWMWAVSGDPFRFLFGCWVGLVLLVVSIIDLDWKIIPDVFSLGLLVSGIAVAPINSFLGETEKIRSLMAVTGACVGYGSAWLLAVAGRRLFGKEALGGGDVKLLAGVGAFMGPSGVLVSWLLGSMSGSLFFFLMKWRRSMDWGGYIPFGPFLAAGAWVHWIWPGLFRWGFGF